MHDTARRDAQDLRIGLRFGALLLVVVCLGAMAWGLATRSPHGAPLAQGGAPLLIDLNTADAAMLRLLPGIGPALAGRIVEDREANGPFASVEDLQRVRGIGPRISEGVRGLVVVGGATGDTEETRDADLP